MKSYLLRAVKLNDIEEIFGFERDYVIEHEPKLLGIWDSCRDDSMKRMKENLDRMFVAVVDDQAVGPIYWSLLEDKPCIYGIFVTMQAL